MVTLKLVLSYFVFAALLSAGVAATGGGGVKTRRGLETNVRTGMVRPAFDQLVRAVKLRDRGAIERIVERIGPGRLAQGLAQPDRRVVLAVLSAVPGARGSVLLTEPIANLTSSGDPAIAAAAARTLGELLDGDAPADLEQWEVPPDVIWHACGALHGLALRGLAAAPARLAALAALADAASICGDTDGLLPGLKDPDPALRRATAQVVRVRSPAAIAALHESMRDSVATVTSAAVAALCRARAGTPSGKSDPTAGGVVEAARLLILQPATPIDDAVDLLACLATSATPADKKIEELIRRGPPSPLRDRAAELVEPNAVPVLAPVSAPASLSAPPKGP
ncbi:MAG: hypothetical protein QOI66_1236 [Myxococcales bacterium]|nr:hypothetical protein [Myxococcales bacterium]